MKKQLTKRLLALVLAFTMVLGMAPVAFAGNGQKVEFEQVDNDVVGASLPESRKADTSKEKPLYGDKDIVRVSIFLEDAATISVFSQEAADGTLAESVDAKEYRAALQMQQEAVAEYISEQVLEDEDLDVVWNLTLAANAISANVEYGQIEAIKQAYGVSDVIVETRYEPMVASVEANDPNMATSSAQIGSGLAWAAGYYGKGSKIAVIDTGTDTDHQSFDADAFLYAVGDDADLMDADDIAAVLDQLNIATLVDDASKLYLNAKLPFAFNYVDEDFDVIHDNDTQGEHGSHVAGIATANRYIPDGEGGYTEALSSVCTQGVAPDAQLITMKVFGKGGGAYDSDYMAAIEDAIILGADSINLSLGSGNPGFSNHSNSAYQAIMESLTESSAVVCMSAGNSGTWQENTIYGFLYNDGVSMQTDGSPGSYTNSLAVASVDNTGSTGSFLNFGAGLETVSFSETSGYTNAPIATLDTTGEGTEYDFILFSNTGVDGSGNNLLTDYADACAGKVVMVYRGTSSFFEKHNAAEEVGGIACIVMNNQAGTINMDLSDSTATIPCVSILQSDAVAIMAFATPVSDEGGNVLYYTGKVTISSAIAALQGDVDGYWTMSSFSSWGVPGSLELKPEITAPGGNIYSVNGAVAGGKAYENMSGTSMASPQMAGIVAVLAEYIRENKLTETTGLTQRQLAQSLLMSTSEPIIEADSGNYYSILNQGSGVANVNDAINAHSYILMGEGVNAGAADGKVKAELGDDPEKTGKYSFSYELFNLTDEDAEYSFDTDVFTQDVFAAETYSGVDILLDTWTAPLEGAVVTYAVEGGEYEAGRYDVQRVLDAVAGKVQLSTAEETLYDLDENGEITSYDAYLMLLEDKDTGKVTLPANGSVTVTVTIDVSDCDFTYYPTGAYIEAYSYVKELSNDEGLEGTVHSIPVLGYYGNWTAPSMYDVGTLAEIWYETETRYPYLINETYAFTNYVTVKYPGDSGEYYYFGNPLTDDDEYLEERNAINGDTVVNKFYATIIRNAGNSAVQVVDANTGEVYACEVLGSKNSAYYYSNGSAWYNTQSSATVGWQGTDAQGNKLPEDTEVIVSLVLAPEYYADENGEYDWDKLTDGVLGDGAYLSIRTAIDNTAPVMTDLVYDAETRTFTATASDNRYLATVALYQNGVKRELDFVAPNQALEDKGAAADYILELPANNTGSEFYIQLTDYAMNQTTYKFVITEEGVNDDPVNPTKITLPETASVVKGTAILLTPEFEPFLAKEEVVWTSADENIATVDANGKVTGVAVGEVAIKATSAYDETVYAECKVTVVSFDVTLYGALQDVDGNPQLFTWNLETDKTWKKTADLKNNINAITYDFAHEDGPMFQMDTEGYLYKVDVATGTTLEKSAAAAEFGAPVDDMEYAGLSSLTSEQDVLVGVYGYYLLYSMPGMDNTFSSGWNMSGYLGAYLGASNFTAVAWAGYDNRGRDVFFCLTDSCDFWVMMPDFTTGSAGMNFYETDLDLEFPGYDGAYYCSMVMGDDGNFYLSYFNGSTNQIYVLEGKDIYQGGEYYDTVYHATLLGDVGDAVWPAGLLAVVPNEDETAAAAERELDVEAIIENVQAESFETEELVGSLNAVTVSNRTDKLRDTIQVSSDAVNLKLIAESASNNGLVTVEYDPSEITLLNTKGSAQWYSWYEEEKGLVNFAYADLNGFDVGEVLGALKFSFNHSGVETELVVTTLEENADYAADVRVVTLMNEATPTPVGPAPAKPVKPVEPVTPVEPEQPEVPEDPHTANCPSAQFADLDVNAWYHEYTDAVIGDGIMNGVGNGNFDPAANVTRSQLVTMLWRLAGSPVVNYAMSFEDVAEGTFYSEAVRWAASTGVVTGINDTTFAPDENITREQLATILFRLAQNNGLNVSNAGNTVPDFVDRDQISTWAGEAMCWAYTNGIINGKGANALDPKGTASRVEAAAMMVRFQKLTPDTVQQ